MPDYCESVIPDPIRTRKSSLSAPMYFVLRHGKWSLPGFQLCIYLSLELLVFGSNLADYYLKKGFVSGNDNLVGGDLKNVDNRINFLKLIENLEN